MLHLDSSNIDAALGEYFRLFDRFSLFQLKTKSCSSISTQTGVASRRSSSRYSKKRCEQFKDNAPGKILFASVDCDRQRKSLYSFYYSDV